jgi:uncharacterized glyoxalase superfamily protein PhnB
MSHHPLAVMITCKDAKKSIAFYRDVCGFQLEAAWPDEKAPMWANMVLDGQSVMLGQNMKPEGPAMAKCSAEDMAYHKARYEEMEKNKPGVGIQVYLAVADVDAHHQRVTSKGGKALSKPQDRFYGIRDFVCEDPDGFKLIFYKNIQMKTCQSCGMPLENAKSGQMYCGYCTDASGKLKPWETVLEGTIQGYFVGMKKMPRPEAEKAAREHLSRMPAWVGRAK